MYIVSTIRLGSTKICIYIATKKPPILLSLMLDSYWIFNSSHNNVKYLTLSRMHFQTLYFWFYILHKRIKKIIAIVLTDFLPKASDDTNIKLTSLPGLLSFSYTHETKAHIWIGNKHIKKMLTVINHYRNANWNYRRWHYRSIKTAKVKTSENSMY